MVFSACAKVPNRTQIDLGPNPRITPEEINGMPAKRLNFTKSALLSIESPDADRAEYRDTQIDGLVLRVTKNGVKTFSLFRWVKGRGPERIAIGRFPEISVEIARNKARELIGQIAIGNNPAEMKRKANAEMTFGEFFSVYMERHAKPHKKTWKEDLSKFNQYLNDNKVGVNIATKKLSEISRGDVKALHVKIGKDHEPTANRIIALISSVYGRAYEWDVYNGVNPAGRIKKYSEVQRERFLQRDELGRYFQALALEPNQILRRFFLLCLLTGARRGNVMAMRWADIDTARAVWTIPGAQSKNKRRMSVVLTADALAVLAECKNDSEWVFPGSGATGHLVEPKKAWLRMLDNDELLQLIAAMARVGHPFKCPSSWPLARRLRNAREAARALNVDITSVRLPDLRPHDLRRTMGSYQAIGGTSLPIIGQSLGHKSTASTWIYARFDQEPVRRSVNAATQTILTLGGVRPAERQIEDVQDENQFSTS